jgi:virginiamycin B lyase
MNGRTSDKTKIIVRERSMKSPYLLGMTALALVLAIPASGRADQPPAALTGVITSQAEGAMEGVVVTAHKDGSIVSVSVTTDAQGRYAFPENRLEPGHYNLAIRAVGYDISAPAAADVVAEKTANTDIKLDKTKNLASQLTNAEWMMSIPGTED